MFHSSPSFCWHHEAFLIFHRLIFKLDAYMPLIYIFFFSVIHAILSRNRCIYQGRASEFTGDKSKVGLWICRNIKQASNSPHTVSHFPKYPGGFILQSTPAVSGVYYTTCLFCWKRHKGLPAPMIITSLKALTVSPDFNYIVSFFFPRAEPLWKS